MRFLFGCEADTDRDHAIGLSRCNADEPDFAIVAITHMHMIFRDVDADAAERARMYSDPFDTLLDSGLPFRKMSLANPTSALIYRGGRQEDVLSLISDREFRRLFDRAAHLGLAVELNFNASAMNDDTLRPYRIAREMGCKFYFGSDAHTPDAPGKVPEKPTPLSTCLDSVKTTSAILCSGCDHVHIVKQCRFMRSGICLLHYCYIIFSFRETLKG